jgi:hypothetical protein
MSPAIRTSRTVVAAFLSGLLAFACGVLAVASESDVFLLGVVLFAVLAVVLGIFGWVRVWRAPDRLRGKALAGWCVGLPVGAVALGFLLLPAV